MQNIFEVGAPVAHPAFLLICPQNGIYSWKPLGFTDACLFMIDFFFLYARCYDFAFAFLMTEGALSHI